MHCKNKPPSSSRCLALELQRVLNPLASTPTCTWLLRPVLMTSREQMTTAMPLLSVACLGHFCAFCLICRPAYAQACKLLADSLSRRVFVILSFGGLC